MTAALAIELGGPVAAALLVWLCTRGYYRAAYGDRYQRGRDDEREAQIRARQAARRALAPWDAPRMLPAPVTPQDPRGPYGDGEGVTVLGSWHPHAAGPPRGGQLPPGQPDGEPPTSEWARDLIKGIETWNAANLPARDLPWHG